MNTLAPELLCGIFRELDDWRARVRCATVCSQWRTVALADSQLWTHITGEMLPDLVEALEARSGSAPLHIDCTNFQHHDEHGVAALLTRQLWRIATLKIRDRFVESPMVNVLSLPAPLLVTFDVYTPFGALTDRLFGGHAPRLRTVRFKGNGFPYACPAFRHVLHFQANRMSLSRMQTASICLSEIMPKLEKVSLKADGDPDFVLDGGHRLRALDIKAGTIHAFREDRRLATTADLCKHLRAFNHELAQCVTVEGADGRTIALVLDAFAAAADAIAFDVARDLGPAYRNDAHMNLRVTGHGRARNFIAVPCRIVSSVFSQRPRFSHVRTFRCASMHLMDAPQLLPHVSKLVVEFTRRERDAEMWYENFRLWLDESTIPALDTLVLSAASAAYFPLSGRRIADALSTFPTPLRRLEVVGLVFEDGGEGADALTRVALSVSCSPLPTSQTGEPVVVS